MPPSRDMLHGHEDRSLRDSEVNPKPDCLDAIRSTQLSNVARKERWVATPYDLAAQERRR